jgi:hypothetical protein
MMADDNAVAYALGVLENLIESDKNLQDPAKIKGYLKTVESGFNDYRRLSKLLQKGAEQKQEREKPKFSSDEGAPAKVLLEEDTSLDPDNFGNLFVHISSGNDEYQPGRVFRGSLGVCFELWPIPKKLTMTLTELKALVHEIEVHKSTLPYDDGQTGIGS